MKQVIINGPLASRYQRDKEAREALEDAVRAYDEKHPGTNGNVTIPVGDGSVNGTLAHTISGALEFGALVVHAPKQASKQAAPKSKAAAKPKATKAAPKKAAKGKARK